MVSLLIMPEFLFAGHSKPGLTVFETIILYLPGAVKNFTFSRQCKEESGLETRNNILVINQEVQLK